jgi:triosephosphate isomerase
MSRTPFLAGNWKMNLTRRKASALARAVAEARPAHARVALFPAFPHLDIVRSRLRGSGVLLGAQNCHTAAEGAYTGEVSAPMLKDAGLEIVLVGHSERRHVFGETDELINRKMAAALAHGLLPIFCVGETLAQFEAGRTREVVARQLREGLAGVADLGAIVIAYEPVWAVGTGRPATPEGANAVMGDLRAQLADLFTATSADAVRILYGGSVTPDNFLAFMAQPHIDGGLVGGASLVAASFITLTQQAAAARVPSGD